MSQSKKSKEVRRPADAPTPETHAEDDLIVVPKGSSRLRFYLTILLTVFVLIVFVVAEPMMGAAGGRGAADEDFVRWTGLDGKQKRLSRADFLSEKLRFGYLEDGIVRAMGLAAQRVQRDDEAARLIVMDDLARSWGIEITDQELADQLRALFGPDLVGYDLYVRRIRTLSKASFEAVLRRAMRIQRFEMFLASGMATADPGKVVERWQDRHREFAFDYVQTVSEDYFDEARAALPSDEELEAWLAARSEIEKSRYLSAERYTAEAAYVPFGPDLDATLLLERYPRAEDSDATELARDYYNRFSHVRFQRPEPLPEPERGEGEEESEQDPLAERDRIYLTFDEAQEQALREAPIYFAMQDWLRDLRARAEGEGLDLAREAGELGLSYERIDAPQTRQQWTDEVQRPWTGRFVVGSHGNVEPGQLVGRVVVDEGAIVISRVLERFPRAMPPFAEIREQVADAWAAVEATQVGLRRLEALYESLKSAAAEGDEPPATIVLDEGRFAELVSAAGFEVLRRDYAGRFATPPMDGDQAQIEAYLRTSSLFYAGPDGEVFEPSATRAGSHAFLVRLAGRRDADLSKMKPDELMALRQQLQQQSVTTFFQDTYRSQAFLEQRHGLWLRDFAEGQ